MIEDIPEYDAFGTIPKQQAPPLKLPPLDPRGSVNGALSPRFDDLMVRSTSLAWSPGPLDGTQYGQFARAPPNPLSSVNTFGRTYESNVTTTSIPKRTDSMLSANNSSRAQMIKSVDKKTDSTSSGICSNRCKLGILGFAIGLLAVGIALAVVLVLWLRQ